MDIVVVTLNSNEEMVYNKAEWRTR